jgi:hypothetical protein
MFIGISGIRYMGILPNYLKMNKMIFCQVLISFDLPKQKPKVKENSNYSMKGVKTRKSILPRYNWDK